MKKIIILLLISLVMLPSMATRIDVKTNATTQHGGARMPTITSVAADYNNVAADYNNNVLTVDIQKYTGTVRVFIYDDSGDMLETTIGNICGNGSLSTDISTLTDGEYTIKHPLFYWTCTSSERERSVFC